MAGFNPQAFTQGVMGAHSLLQSPYTVPMTQAQLAQLRAQAALTQAKAQDPMAMITGQDPAAQALKLNVLKNQYGEQSEVYKNAHKQWRAQIDYKEKLAAYLPSRFTSPLGKTALEQRRLQLGISPTGEPWGTAVQPSLQYQQSQPGTLQNTLFPQAGTLQGQLQGMLPVGGAQPAQQDLSQAGQQLPEQPSPADQVPEFAKGLPAQYELLRQKNVTDPLVRQKTSYGNAFANSLARMDPQVLELYSGIKGQTKLAHDSILSQYGTVTPEYKKYLDYKANADLATSQARQFYSDSIQPKGLKRLEDIINPISIMTGGKASLEKFNAFKDSAKADVDTWHQAMVDPEIYRKGKIFESPRVIKFSEEEPISQIHSASLEEINAELAKRSK